MLENKIKKVPRYEGKEGTVGIPERPTRKGFNHIDTVNRKYAASKEN